ncbi:MAG: iron ABC transporter permease [Anaerobacillus sp.]
MMEVDSLFEIQKQKNRRRFLMMGLFLLLIVVTFFISMNTGLTKLSPVEVLKTLFGNGTEKQSLILFEFRLPRIVIAVLVGAGLAISGCILQGISRNALADPGILGINSGAALMVVIFISFFPKTADAPILLMPFLALVGGCVTAAIIYVLSYSKRNGLMPQRMLLNGIAIAAGIGALITILTLRMDPFDYQFIAVWLAGKIWGTTWVHVLTLLPWIIVLFTYIFYKSRILDGLNFGEQLATGMGVKVEKERFLLLGAAVALASACVSVSGGIGFVGLVGPHLARQLVGNHHRFLLPLSALAGGLVLLVADTIGRTILAPSEIHAGIMVAIIGAPYFLYLLARSKA